MATNIYFNGSNIFTPGGSPSITPEQMLWTKLHNHITCHSDNLILNQGGTHISTYINLLLLIHRLELTWL